MASPAATISLANVSLAKDKDKDKATTKDSKDTADAATPTSLTPKKASMLRRIDIDPVVEEFHKALGPGWDRYQDVMTHFIAGKLTRVELKADLESLLVDNRLLRMHNHFLLANMANALRDSAPSGDTSGSGSGALTGWSKNRSVKRPARSVKGDGQLAKLKQDIMGLSVRERKRIKAIGRESGKKPLMPSVIASTRQAMLPRLPIVNDKREVGSANGSANGSAIVNGLNGNERTPPPRSSPVSSSASASAATANMDKNYNTVQWIQDIIHSYDAPLASETFEIPDAEALNMRMLGTALEHGLLKGVDRGCSDVMLNGLEQFLKDVVHDMHVRSKRRRPAGAQGPDVLGPEDMANVLDMSPHTFVETASGPLYRLSTLVLDNDDADRGFEPVPSNPDPGLRSLLREVLS